MPSPEPRGGYEAAGISSGSRRCGGDVAARGARAAAECDAGDRVSQRAVDRADTAHFVAAFRQGLAEYG